LLLPILICLLQAFGLAQEFRTEDLNRLSYFEVVSPRINLIPPPGPGQDDSAVPQQRIAFSAFGKFFELDVEENRLYSQGAQIRWVGSNGVLSEEPRPIHFKGRVSDDDSSWLRLTVDQGEIEGMISTEENIYFIVPGPRTEIRQGAPVNIIYRLSDVVAGWDDHHCAIGHEVAVQDVIVAGGQPEEEMDSARSKSPLDRYGLSMDEFQSMLPAETLKQAEVHLVADGAYYSLYQGNSAARMASVINVVTGIYEEELGVRISIGQSTVYTEATDPFTVSTDPGQLLTNFTFDEPHVQGFDLAHLFTGRDLNGGAVGIAWMAVVCNNVYATGISQDVSSLDVRIVLTAHEMGHNFASEHDGSSGHGCEWGFIMWPSVIPDAREFSTCSKAEMNSFIDSRSCLAEIDIPVSPPSAPTNLRLLP